MGEHIVAVRKNEEGDIIEFKLGSGKVVDYKVAQMMAKSREIEGVNVFKGRDGEDHIRSNADGDQTNNLDQLPAF